MRYNYYKYLHVSGVRAFCSRLCQTMLCPTYSGLVDRKEVRTQRIHAIPKHSPTLL